MLFQRLREETRDLHEQIEQQLPVLQSDFTLERYYALLRRYLAFYTPVEDELTRLRSLGLSMFTEDRRKCPLLLRDLNQVSQPDYLPCSAVPRLQSVSRGIGCMYVLEGSTLGGQIISRHLRQKLGITPDNGGAFFASYGADLGRRWSEFRDSVIADARAETDTDEIIDAARDTFRCFDMWLKPQEASIEH